MLFLQGCSFTCLLFTCFFCRRRSRRKIVSWVLSRRSQTSSFSAKASTCCCRSFAGRRLWRFSEIWGQLEACNSTPALKQVIKNSQQSDQINKKNKKQQQILFLSFMFSYFSSPTRRTGALELNSSFVTFTFCVTFCLHKGHSMLYARS